jgi:hypothetical protein
MPTKVSLLTSPALRAAIIAGIRTGVPLIVSWRKAGLSTSTYADWAHVAANGQWRNGSNCPPEHLAIIQDFVEAVEQARAEFEAEMVEKITKAARERNEKTGQLDWRPAAWLLEHGHARGRWYSHKETTVVPKPEAPERPRLRDLSDEKLIELAGDEWREILGPSASTEPDGDSLA